jgi:hypothetical protein
VPAHYAAEHLPAAARYTHLVAEQPPALRVSYLRDSGAWATHSGVLVEFSALRIMTSQQPYNRVAGL